MAGDERVCRYTCASLSPVRLLPDELLWAYRRNNVAEPAGSVMPEEEIRQVTYKSIAICYKPASGRVDAAHDWSQARLNAVSGPAAEIA